MPGRYLVRVHPSVVRPHVPVRTRAEPGTQRMAFTATTAAAVPDAVAEPLDFLHANAGLENVRPLFAQAGRANVRRAHLDPLDQARLSLAASVVTEADDALAGLSIIEVDPAAGEALLRHAESAQAIDFIEPVPARWLLATGPDPMRNQQWSLRATNWFQAKRPDVESLTVGICDTGIDEKHPDLAGVAVTYAHPGTKPTDLAGHGTHVAGIIAAETNNEIGIAGVANCGLHMWKVFGDEPVNGRFLVDPDLFADALRDAATSGIVALNLSLGGTRASQGDRILIRRLVDAGVLVVAAMGNDFKLGNPTMYPAAYDDVLAVGSIAENRERSDFSNTGDHIGLCAPGSNILSTVPRSRSAFRKEHGYASWSGTSMAAPHVAAAAALVAAKHGAWTGADVGAHLVKTAAKLTAMKRRARTDEYGSGLLDLEKALK